MSNAFGHTLSSEEWPPRELVETAKRVEAAGFDFCSISDHFHPWLDGQGHSPFVWSVLGAIAEATDRIEVGVGVTCPTVRTHPAIIAQAAATTSLLFEGRFVFGVGSGEALNETILGHRWPPAPVRLRMLEEAMEVMRALWSGDEVVHDGEFYRVENARLYDPPEGGDLTTVVSAFGTKAAEVASRIGDGLWSTSPDAEVIETYRSAGGEGPVYGQLTVCYGEDEAACRKLVAEQWPNAGFAGELAQELRTPAHFGQVADSLTEDQAVGPTPCGPDLDAIVAAAKEYLDAGFDHLYFHQVGPDQAAFIEAFEGELGADLRAL